MLIINADDFGLNPTVNRAIVEAFTAGLCSSSTIMANMPGFEEACELVHQHGLENHVGIHLVLTEGVPLTDKMRALPRFCNRQDTFGLSRKKRVIRLSSEERQALAGEIEAQIEKCRKHHLHLTHLDSHNHTHEEWGIASVVLPIVRAQRIPYMRLSRNYGPSLSPAKRAYKYVFNRRLLRAGLARTTHFGSPEDFRLYLADPRHRQAPDRSWEVMVHPDFDEQGRLVDSWIGKPLKSAVEALQGHGDAVSYGGRRYVGRSGGHIGSVSRVGETPSCARFIERCPDALGRTSGGEAESGFGEAATQLGRGRQYCQSWIP